MSLPQEVREKMVKYLQSSSTFHGEFKYPDWAFEFADRATCQTVEMPPVSGHPYTIYIYTAKNKKPDCPVHINIHGGGFSNPHQINDALWSAWLADQIQGMVVDVDYTLSGDAAWPTCLEQCRDAGRYTYAHCAQWGCDPKQISIGGYSAGGTLTMAVLMKAKETGEVPYCLGVNGYGPCELDMCEKDRPQQPEYWTTAEGRNFAFVDLLFDGDVEKSHDPYFAAANASDEQLTGLPPVLVISAGEDPFRFENERMALRLATLGNQVTVCRVVGARHGFIPHFMEHWNEGGRMIVKAIKAAAL